MQDANMRIRIANVSHISLFFKFQPWEVFSGSTLYHKIIYDRHQNLQLKSITVSKLAIIS